MATLCPLSPLLSSSVVHSVLLILNRPLEPEIKVLKQLWSKAVYRACADGGSNRLYNTMGGDRDSYIPNIITGDFDSAHKSVLDYYRNKGVDVVITEDQDETDFSKCLRVTLQKTADLQYDFITVIGAFGGRLDHLFGNINTLFLAHTLTKKPVVLISEGSVACLLGQGKHVLKVDTGLEDDWCGLIPMGATCDHVTTTGLKWNLDNQALQFGDLISTSNTYDGSQAVTIETDKPLLWTMGYKSI
ncbi:thiamin pyrophosphokinase 1-like [Haliotis rufescens]|uniref:thiamin pyrophosphokinase 1-like n=1 Tax=Haliotis rufescens TaxID=6454 RepID=UPI00201EB079|nr:thiamin pyrophosphokinase 1-like [Haliotis rufescens]